MNMDINLLSAQAKEKYNKLQQQLQEIVSADRVREPKLTDEEKAEVATNEACLAEKRPVSEKLLNLMKTRRERLNFLVTSSISILQKGGDVDALVTEKAMLSDAVQLLEEAYNQTNREINVAEGGIRRLKEKAREREIRHEAAQNE